jgi:hypothetical protein
MPSRSQALPKLRMKSSTQFLSHKDLKDQWPLINWYLLVIMTRDQWRLNPANVALSEDGIY